MTRSAATTLATALAALLIVGGCTVQTDQPDRATDRASSRAAEVLAGKARFDLTKPPSRAEAGLPTGETNVTYERKDDKKPFKVILTLPDGKELTPEVTVLTFDAYGSADPKTQPPVGADFKVNPASPDAAKEHLLAAAKQFGFDTKAIDAWYDETKQPRPPQAPPHVESGWLTAKLGYLTISVQARYLPSREQPGHTVVHYTLTWGPSSS